MFSEDITMHDSITTYSKPGDKRKGKLPVGVSVSEEESRPPTSPTLPQRRRNSDLPPRGAARIKYGNETWHAEHPAMFPFGETVYSANYLSKQVLQNLDRGKKTLHYFPRFTLLTSIQGLMRVLE